MNRRISRFLLLAAVAASTGIASAQFSLEGQYRPRLEVRNGFKTPITEAQSPAAFIEQRARLTAGYKKDKVGFKLSIQDVRIWGEVGQINKSDNLLSAHEAYGDYYMSDKSTLRVGRQEVIYDGARFFGNLDWAMQGRALDAVRYIYKSESSQLELMGSWNQTGYGDGAPEPAKLTGTGYTTANGGGTNRIFNLGLPKAQFLAYYKYSFENGSLGFMALNDNYHTSAGDKWADFTLAVTPEFTFGDVKAGGQFYYTGGKASKDVDLGGYLANVYIQLPKVVGSPLIGVDYISGDDASTTDKVEGWNPKYGTNHAFYGFMDYFFVGNGHGGGNSSSAGLMDVYLKTKFKLGDKTALVGHAHYFASTAERTDATTGETYQGGLGTEVDLVLVHKVTDGITLKAGYSQMFGISDTMKLLKTGSASTDIAGMQSWGWIMLAYAPKFL